MGNKRPVASLNTFEYDELITVLKEARNEKGVSQRELASRLGQSPRFVNHIEHKERRIDVVEFYQVCMALDVNPNVLFAQFIEKITQK